MSPVPWGLVAYSAGSFSFLSGTPPALARRAPRGGTYGAVRRPAAAAR